MRLRPVMRVNREGVNGAGRGEVLVFLGHGGRVFGVCGLGGGGSFFVVVEGVRGGKGEGAGAPVGVGGGGQRRLRGSGVGVAQDLFLGDWFGGGGRREGLS